MRFPCRLRSKHSFSSRSVPHKVGFGQPQVRKGQGDEQPQPDGFRLLPSSGRFAVAAGRVLRVFPNM